MTARQLAADEARRLIRICRKGVLATNGSNQEKYAPGWPSSSLVTYATAWDGSPLFLLSTLSHHTQNAMRDSRVSLLVDGTDRHINPQEGPRVSVVGHLKLENDTRLHRRFLAKHARAKLYAGFSDFQFYKLTVEKLHYVGGFARALWISKKKAVLPKSAWQDIAVSEESILRHMNSDHQQTIGLYGTKLLKKQGRHWSLIGVDPEGLDLMCGQGVHRLPFDSSVADAEQCRKMLVRLAKQARDL